MIHIQQLNKQQLSEYIYSEEYKQLKHIPITKHRALSHSSNPRADDEDILLLLAYEGKELVGYLGVLPDQIFYNNKFEKCGWLSCLWIDTEHRGKQIAFKLVQKSIEVWNKRILVTEFTEPAKRLYDKTNNFVDFEEKKGLRLYIRFNLEKILAPKKEIFKKAKFLLKTFDFISNLLFDLRFHFYNKQLANIQLEYINHIDKEVGEFITNKQQNQIFRRGADELNWIIKNPWILSSPASDYNSKKYHFSSLEKRFEFVAIKVYNHNNELSAFLIFARRNDDLKLPYYYGDDIESIIKVISYHLLKWKVKTFTTYSKTIATKLKESRTPALLKKEVKRAYIISSTFDTDLLERPFIIQDGDADCSFT